MFHITLPIFLLNRWVKSLFRFSTFSFSLEILFQKGIVLSHSSSNPAKVIRSIRKQELEKLWEQCKAKNSLVLLWSMAKNSCWKSFCNSIIHFFRHFVYALHLSLCYFFIFCLPNVLILKFTKNLWRKKSTFSWLIRILST